MGKRDELLKQLLEEMTVYEKKYWNEGYVVGVDEVGRGPLAGPVTVCAYAFKIKDTILGVKDSKKLTEKRRGELFDELVEIAADYKVVSKDQDVIDSINILNATKMAMKEAVEGLDICPRVVLVDAVTIPELKFEQIPIIKGDSKSISIAAASIIAKVTRDKYMAEISKEFPEYGFDKNKGYGTKVHMDAIRKFGLTKIHRKSFCKNV